MTRLGVETSCAIASLKAQILDSASLHPAPLRSDGDPRRGRAADRGPASALFHSGYHSRWLSALPCRSLRAVRSARRFWLVCVFTCTGRCRLTRIIGAIPRTSLRSVLFGWALKNAFTWRVAIQITGDPALASSLNNHSDMGPASSPTRSLSQLEFFMTASKSPGWSRCFTLRQVLPRFVDNANAGLFNRDIEADCFMLRFLS